MYIFWSYYIIFSITTAIVATIFLFVPVVYSTKILRHKPVYRHRALAVFTMFILAVLTSPLLIVPILNKEHGDRFKEILLVNLNS